ncbi:MAG: type II secretion system F family protein [Lachnospiraceae bacterium]|nr:type II secretion system F family protein [Lachnospiraceae bacterium]
MSKHTDRTPLTNSEVSSFCGQIALILKSGISSIEGISIMLEDAQSEGDKELLQTIYDTLLETGSFYQAVESCGLFPTYMLRMTDIGEKTGTLDEVMQQLTIHYEREDSISVSIRNAITYPMIMAGMMIVVIVVLLVKVMPIFNQVFVQLGTEMTGFSRTLMDIGNIINRYSVVFIALLVVVVGIIIYGCKTKSGQNLFHKIGYKIPFVRTIFENTAACRFASGLSLTLKSGIDTTQSLHLAGSLNSDPFFQQKLDLCFAKIEEGMDYYEAMHQCGIFSGVYARMISLGARTGTMDQVMDNVASLYQEEVDRRINNLLSILEPTLVVSLSLFVGIILLSVMLPLIGIMSSI